MSFRAAALASSVLLLCACDAVFGLREVHPPDDKVPIDVNPPNAIVVETSGHAHGKEVRAVEFPIVGVDRDDDVLLVFAAVGSYCTDTSVPTATLTYAGTMPSAFHTKTGTPCNDMLSRSYLWVISNPPAGSNNVTIDLGAPAHSLHGGALLLSRVDAAAPVRAVADGTERSFSSSVEVTSEVGDLVVSFVGQGGTITNPGPGDTVHYIDDVDNSTTMDNTGLSTIAGARPSVAAMWTFGAEDEWQAIAVSLRPAP